MDLGEIFQSAHVKLYYATPMTVRTVILNPVYACDDINILCFSDFLCTTGLTSTYVNQSRKLISW